MYFTIFLALFVSVAAKIYILNTNYDNGLSDDDYTGVDNYKRLDTINRRPLWILSLKDDSETPKLRQGTQEENFEFEFYAGPLIVHSRTRQMIHRMKKDDPEHPKALPNSSEEEMQESAEPQNSAESESAESQENVQLQQEIRKIINKFALSTNAEPDIYLSESEENDPTIELYFKGDYTSLIVKFENKLWHYFINPPSPLPAWFYDIHDIEADVVEVPEEVRNKFYKSLLHMLRSFLGFPV